MCICICVFVFVYSYLCICICICICLFVFVYFYLCICIFVFVYLCLSICICIFVFLYLYLSISICVFVFEFGAKRLLIVWCLTYSTIYMISCSSDKADGEFFVIHGTNALATLEVPLSCTMKSQMYIVFSQFCFVLLCDTAACVSSYSFACSR